MKIISFLLFLVLIGSTGCKPKAEAVQTQPVATTPAPEAPSSQAAPVPPPVSNLGPLESIKDLDRKIESYKTGDALTPEDIEANRALKESIIRGTFDLYELCRLALSSHWEQIDDKQRTYFADLMTRLLEKKALFSKEQVKGDSKGYRVTYKSEQFLDAEKKTSLVSTKVLVPTEKIDLNINYKLIRNERGWNIFDVIVDDASLVENYKFQFDTIIKKYGYPDLINRMEKKLAEMK